MIEPIVFRCNTNYEPHPRHEWRSGFLWLDKHTCDGIPEHICTYDCSNPCGAKFYYGNPVNVLRAQAGLPPYEPTPHKHKLFFGGLGKHVDELVFFCLDCPKHYEVRVQRWKFRELTMSPPKVNQNWPQ